MSSHPVGGGDATSSPAPFPRPADAQPGDVLDLAFADESQRVFGWARVEIDERTAHARSLVAVFADGRPLAVAAGAAPLAPDGSPSRTGRSAPGTIDGGSLVLLDDGGEWEARFAGGPGATGAFAVRCAASHPWLAGAPDGGERHLQRVQVTGDVQTEDGPLALRAEGRLSFSRGSLPSAAPLRRELAVWVGEGLTIDVVATRERLGDGHDAERLQAVLIEHDPPSLQTIEEPRLSTTYDADGRPLRAGLELWLSEESGYARRAAGETLCAATLTTAAGRFDCAFLQWRIEARTGVGPYVLWRSARDGR